MLYSFQHPSRHAHRDWPFRRSALKRYGVAVLVVAAAFLARYVFYGDMQNRLAFTFCVPAALIAAWYGGLGPGMLATGLGLVLGSYFFLLTKSKTYRSQLNLANACRLHC